MRKRVLLGMSGGIDSSTSALLLQRQGYEVIGITLKLWNDESKEANISDAKKVCDSINIQHYTLNFENEFKEYVVNDFINCYANCQTPNPCIECNKHIKFDLLYKKAKDLGCDFIATGHYARIEYSEKYNEYVLKKSNEIKKDQTYFLYGIDKEILPQILFPLADYTEKKQVRKLARENNLEVAEKPDSQEVCFIPDNDYGSFLEKNIAEKPEGGNIVLKNRRSTRKT